MSLLGHHLRILNGDAEYNRINSWLFVRGMLFEDIYCWWEEKTRAMVHEGVDFYFFQNKDSSFGKLMPGVRLPVLFAGKVYYRSTDFLGESVWLQNPFSSAKGRATYVGYSHICLSDNIIIGDQFFPGQFLGTLAKGKNNCKVPPHLHVSVVDGPEDIEPSQLGWSALHKCSEIHLLDPSSVSVLI